MSGQMVEESAMFKMGTAKRSVEISVAPMVPAPTLARGIKPAGWNLNRQ